MQYLPILYVKSHDAQIQHYCLCCPEKANSKSERETARTKITKKKLRAISSTSSIDFGRFNYIIYGSLSIHIPVLIPDQPKWFIYCENYQRTRMNSFLFVLKLLLLKISVVIFAKTRN